MADGNKTIERDLVDNKMFSHMAGRYWVSILVLAPRDKFSKSRWLGVRERRENTLTSICVIQFDLIN